MFTGYNIIDIDTWHNFSANFLNTLFPALAQCDIKNLFGNILFNWIYWNALQKVKASQKSLLVKIQLFVTFFWVQAFQ